MMMSASVFAGHLAHSFDTMSFILFLGDTLYYIFTSDNSTNDWGWKFVVTGGQLGR